MAARQAERAAKKAARRGRQAEEIENRALRRVEDGRRWMQQHRQRLVIVTLLALLATAGVATWWQMQRRDNERASAMLITALRRWNAPLNDDKAKPEAEKKTLSSAEERARLEKARADFGKVARTFPETETGAWARLIEAQSQLRLGQIDRAQASIKALLAEKHEGALYWRIVDLAARLDESQERWGKAADRYASLAKSEQGWVKSNYELQAIRMLLLEGKQDEASKKLRTLIEGLGKNEKANAEDPVLASFKREAENLQKRIELGEWSQGAAK